MNSTEINKQFVLQKSNIGTKNKILVDFKKNKFLLLIVLPGLLYYLIFNYLPMFGLVIAFKDYRVSAGFLEGDWIGFKHFVDFFKDPYFFKLLRNTFAINLYNLILGFPLPIILALLLNEVRVNSFKRIVQTISYLPNFISIVIVSGMVINFLSPQTGIVNLLLKGIFGIEPISFMTKPEYFWGIFTLMNVWKTLGWNSILYIAAISGVNLALYDAAVVDGASRFRRIWHVTLPSISPTIIIVLILTIGQMLKVGAEPIILMYNPTIYETADVISTYVYRAGFGTENISPNYSFATAVGLFNSVVSLVLLYSANLISRKFSETSLW
ncbi:MAG: sugar ABC transporter permease [Clostridiales bacterium GWC2_40_7]|nr:MAG: sugar ABC transporter permease [Clostridiales bacterium GWC2_40_7]